MNMFTTLRLEERIETGAAKINNKIDYDNKQQNVCSWNYFASGHWNRRRLLITCAD